MVKSIEWRENKVRFIDQTKLPNEEIYIDTDDSEILARAIEELKIRGAPALGVAAAYGIVLSFSPGRIEPKDDASRCMHAAVERFHRTRPTAVNLFWSLQRMDRFFQTVNHLSFPEIYNRLLGEALAIHREDEEMCSAIGSYGADLIPSPATILTHCNTGALATGGTGTAQSVITTAYDQGKKIKVFADETRPLLQGARLTAWELLRHGVDVTLITDNTAAFAIKQKQVDLILVGADRIVSNGDTANKVGTYNLAILAAHHKIPLYVVAPTSSIDSSLADGTMITIEERGADEVTMGFGKRTAPEGINVYSPAFDVTPHELITVIITEKGVVRPPFKENLARIMEK